jgi:CMP-N,N'-diacetyllegionaminic acid synthase
MIRSEKVLGLITARGGSKGVPGKNIRQISGKPLIAWTIEAGLKSKYIDRLILSSDSDEIINVSKSWGCEVPFKRNSELATDQAGSVDVAIDAINRTPGYDWLVLLQPTSPLRRSIDIDLCIEECIQANGSFALSVTKSEKTPYWMYRIENGNLISLFPNEKFTRRQDIPEAYYINGAVYVVRILEFLEKRTFCPQDTVAFIMDKAHSIDIDTEDDIIEFERRLRENNNESLP